MVLLTRGHSQTNCPFHNASIQLDKSSHSKGSFLPILHEGCLQSVVADEHPAVHRAALRGLHHAADGRPHAAHQRHLHVAAAPQAPRHPLRGRRPALQVRVVLLDRAGGRCHGGDSGWCSRSGGSPFHQVHLTILEVDYDMPYRYLVSQTDPSAQKQKCSQSNSSISVQTSSTNSSNSKGFENGGYEEAEEEDYSTIVNGKRAVSLRNFGKFAQKEGLRKNPLASFVHNPRIHNFTISSSYRQPSTSKDVNIDISAAALW
ncbi:dual oxidase maturation factor 1 [Caerostris darwini]|uniref:Dual oxidase maturation factor 1 n=1 Tax=Caerostris darwini TaxID=1538125 RepID=A0AAV4SE94_9ARAC|nr:dual oxidase maturation factor 1 [Caerostris darwini]